MELLSHIDLNIFCLIVCGMLLLYTNGRKEHHSIRDRLFLALVITNIVLLILEIITWMVNGNPSSTAVFLNSTHNVLAIAINPLPALLWAMYIDSQVVQDELRLRKLFVPFTLPLILFMGFAFLNPITHWLFYIDSNNFFHRGPLYNLLAGVNTFYFGASYIIILAHKKQIAKHYYPLLIFPLPIIVGALLQYFFNGLSLMWSGLTLSLLFVYNSIQTKKLTTDFLTGVSNRMGFEQYFNSILNNAHGEPFGGIILDIDNFKQINDRYGHRAGDKALQTAADLLRKSLRKDDFLARYGGDEFIIIVNTRHRSTLEIIVNRINNSVRVYNLSSNAPFKLDFSIGYDIFDKSKMDEDTFIKHIDTLMYKNKKAKVPLQL